MFLLGVAIVTASCSRRALDHEPFPVADLRLFATARLTGSADSVLVRVAARNEAKAQRTLARGICGDQLVLRVYRSGDARRQPRAPVWDSALWRRATEPADRVCLAMAVLQVVPPGDSTAVAALALPLRAVLGDSLPAGRYQMTARLTGSGWQAGEVDAGGVELHAPPT